MKLKTTLTGTDGVNTLKIVVESSSKKSSLSRREQKAAHDEAVNEVHRTLSGRFNVGDIKIR